MQHCDPDALALLALGEDVEVDHAHLGSCDTCQAEVEALRAVVTTARTGPVDVQPVPPPARVWQGIAAATGVSAVPPSLTLPDAPTVLSAASVPTPGTTQPAAAVTDLGARRAEAASRREGRRWPGWALVAAATVGVLAGGGVVGALTGGDAPDGATVSAAALEPLEDPFEAGEAVVLDRDGDRVLRVVAAGLPDEGGDFLQVWLLDAQAQRMVPLGVLRGNEGEFLVPAGLDLGDFPVVDVSVEPVDGDPTHSGHSLLRGTLGA